ncbi:hypothetical protein, partial [Streptomyces capuensis]|uniref:hypothetical protein n=1 Tax=Streptomyces capuensis TaxID=1464056 RepID=UPI0004C187BA
DSHDTLLTTALRVIQATHYARPDSPHADAELQYSREQLALAARDLVEAVDQQPADDQPMRWRREDDSLDLDAIHKHFGLSYANYLVLPRTLLQSMPDAWQNAFVKLLDEMDDA